MQMTREGKELAEIRNFIDTKYSQFGPPTDTGPVFDAEGPESPHAPDSHPIEAAEDGASGLCGQNEEATSCR